MAYKPNPYTELPPMADDEVPPYKSFGGKQKTCDPNKFTLHQEQQPTDPLEDKIAGDKPRYKDRRAISSPVNGKLGGRPPGIPGDRNVHVREACQERSPEVVERLFNICMGRVPGTNLMAMVHAGRELLDRGWGKPMAAPPHREGTPATRIAVSFEGGEAKATMVESSNQPVMLSVDDDEADS